MISDLIWLPKVEISLSEDSKEYICPLYNDAIHLCGLIIAFSSDQLIISVLKQLHGGIESALNAFNLMNSFIRLPEIKVQNLLQCRHFFLQ